MFISALYSQSLSVENYPGKNERQHHSNLPYSETIWSVSFKCNINSRDKIKTLHYTLRPYIFNNDALKIKALVSEDTLLRTHFCPWCFLGCANWETFVEDTKCFWTKSKTFLCPGHKICVRNKCCAREQTGKHLCRQQCVLVCQGLNVQPTTP